MIKATFSAGVEALTVHGLHQWDYGQTLEITHPDLPAVLEVHFAAVGAQDALVRVVSGAVGVAEAPIPDELLEQSRPVLAWVYLVGETSGETMLTVTMPLQARARPTTAGPVPAPIVDKYTEAVAAVNAQVESLKKGDVTVAKALAADKAATADSAATATKAEQDSAGNDISSTYLAKNRGPFKATTRVDFDWDLIQVVVEIESDHYDALLSREDGFTANAALGVRNIKDGDTTVPCALTLHVSTTGEITVSAYHPDTGLLGVVPTAIYYRKI